MIIIKNTPLPIQKYNNDAIYMNNNILNSVILNFIIKHISNFNYSDNIPFIFHEHTNLKINDGKNDINSNPFTLPLVYIRDYLSDKTSLKLNSCVIYKNNTNYIDETLSLNSVTIFLGQGNSIIFKNINTNNKLQEFNIQNGTIIITNNNINNNWYYYIKSKKHPFYILSFKYIPIKPIKISDLHHTDLETTIKTRLLYSYDIYNKLINLQTMNIYDNDNNNFIQINKILGKGNWGNVYLASLSDDKHKEFAVKLIKLEKNDILSPHNNITWYEVLILKDIIKPIIENYNCPNLPLFIDAFICKKCYLKYDNKKYDNPCVNILTELGSGDLKQFFKLNNNLSPKQIYSILFQIMVALHSIQMRGQILNFDIKLSNILYYNIKSGGYWIYIFNGKKFYIPNYGYLIVLNDFGISRLYNPQYKHIYTRKPSSKSKNSDISFILGKRNYININGNLSKFSDGLFYINQNNDIIHNDNTIILNKEQTDFLTYKNLPTTYKDINFFLSPFIIPPTEFHKDTQDVIRMFTGGNRMTQTDKHKGVNLDKDIFSSLSKFIIDDNTELKSYHILAGEFILHFFTNIYDFTVPNDNIIETYNLDI